MVNACEVCQLALLRFIVIHREGGGGGGRTVFSFQKERKLLIEFLSFSNLLLSWHGGTWEVINSGRDCVAAFQPASGNLKQTSGVCLQWRERAREKERWKGTSVSHESPALSQAPSALCVCHTNATGCLI